MRTVILDEPGHFRLTDTTAPAAPGSGEVLVRVLTVGICGTDLHAFEGTQPFFSYPRILGHELAVEVLETGDGVDGFKAGDKCAVNPYMTCGVCAACSRGRTNCCAKMSVIGVHTDGGMRDRILLPAKQMYKCEKLPSALIPLVETLGVGIHAVGRAQAQAGERAIVVGAGPIGLSVIEFLRVAGADIAVVEKMPERLEFAARHYGLTRYYPSHDEARQEEASMLVFDCTGDRTSMESSIQLLQQGGKLIFVGLINDKISLFDPDLHRREATILASRNSTPAEHHRVLDLMESGQIDVSAWPMDNPGPESMGGRFPAWLHREAGVVKAVVNWEI
jgi:2-desacetyl-2-hydroxyethyl bacteriochlorophyllide A dehydrogenase